ncbi:thrombospondin type-1 domain-containing protein 4-like isoform X1 [Scyliorhinus canicula]|uniref:thrombospondin type-1 domain-containing protein 4-like isoform X1 n=2 Tax=Scyliorhinus canicula TaxID=7830 RepID=UPI0018F6F6D0|nr:thrombospondin type-1 domain-containing protein 4-like isoform X1 [Scyliorhinus canicula]
MLHTPQWLIRLVLTGTVFSLQMEAGLVTVNAGGSVQNRVKRQDVDTSTEEEAKGSWGKWGPWSACTRTCGGGVMQQTRPCLPQVKQRVQPTFQFATGDQSLRAFHIPHGRVLSTVRHSFPLHRSSPNNLSGSRINQIYQIPNRGSLNTLRPRRFRAGGSFRSHSSHHRTDADQTKMDDSSDHLQVYQKRTSNPAVGSNLWGQLPQHQTEESMLEKVHVSQPFRTPLHKHAPSEQVLGLQKRQLPRLTRSPIAQSFNCLGVFRQYKSCNSQPCPRGSRDFREVQCSAYNNRAFTGKHYEWEPFTDVTDNQKCELNCRAIGYKFYVRHATQVIDGTPCEPGSLNVCVNGQCKKVGCDEILGSNKVMDKCGVCGGNNTTCKVITGIFKQTIMSVGYHKILEIPEGASRINVTEMMKSRNYLALRTHFGHPIINGNWAIDRPGTYEAAGTLFRYKRPNEISTTAGESFIAEGPTSEILDVYVIYQQANPKVQYEYVLPTDNVVSSHSLSQTSGQHLGEAFNGQLSYRVEGDVYDLREREAENFVSGVHANQLQSRDYQTGPEKVPHSWGEGTRKKREFNWKQIGSSECTVSCGTGSRALIFRCVNRNTHEEVSENLCEMAMRPTPEEEACNINPCPAYWDLGEWSECSKTCGPGIQHRQVLCRQIYANRTTTVQPERCRHLEKPETTTTCQLKICSQWNIRTEWSECSVPCGVGQRIRDVKCIDNLGDIVNDEECNMQLKPVDTENCDMGPCAKSWFHTDWSVRCSAECGPGIQTRSVVCLMNHISSLPLEGCGVEKPEDVRPCNFGPCNEDVRWFTGPWSQCSVECSNGTQLRSVVCLKKTDEKLTVAEAHECSHLERPASEQSCHLRKCDVKWYTTEWSACSKSCEGGYQVREVRCLADDMTQNDSCDSFLRPADKEICNTDPCIPEIDENCRDMYFNCNVVVQARLCVYTYYKTACCASCAKARRRADQLRSR